MPDVLFAAASVALLVGWLGGTWTERKRGAHLLAAENARSAAVLRAMVEAQVASRKASREEVSAALDRLAASFMREQGGGA